MQEQEESVIEDIRRTLAEVVAGETGFVEVRYHARTSRSITVEKGRIEGSTIRRRKGTGVRVLVDGSFGFASCGSADPAEVKRAIERARKAARRSAAMRRDLTAEFPPTELARGHVEVPGVTALSRRSLDEKVELARKVEGTTRTASERITTAACTYTEVIEEKAIVTSDGADCSYRLARPEFRVMAVAEDGGERQVATRAVGATGDWECLFRAGSARILGDQAAEVATDLLRARPPEGGRKTVILAPSIVGLLVHEAIGHTVEADFVRSGSVAAGRLGTRVASEVVTLCDSGASEFEEGAGGTIPIDDEGVPAKRTVIIRRGILESYLHDRESAHHFGVAPTGSARAWEYSDPPLIRMRNTYMEPGESTLEEMIEGVEDGYLLDGPRNGQADATGEFMFGVQRARRIVNGKLGPLVRGVTISGIAFDVMQTVDAVSREFKWDLGAGYCGKGQPAKVDAGGPYVRCRVILGGEQ